MFKCSIDEKLVLVRLSLQTEAIALEFAVALEPTLQAIAIRPVLRDRLEGGDGMNKLRVALKEKWN